MTPSWTDERIAILTQMTADGQSASTIGTELGLSRCSVLGKAFRLGLSRPKPNQGMSASAVRRRRRRSAVVHQAPPPDIEIDIPQQRKTFMELKAHDCRFPIGDPGEDGYLFCGGTAVPGRPYCRYHCRIAYYKPPPERRMYIPARRDVV